MWKAFLGANGWYVAFEGDDGFHHQPTHYSAVEEGAAREEADLLSREWGLTASRP